MPALLAFYTIVCIMDFSYVALRIGCLKFLIHDKCNMAAFSEGEMRSRIPVIVILGATGSGKSKLGIEIARKFAGEILSADSMQVSACILIL